MAKSKSVYVCQNCGVESSKWVGKCPSCGEWNTFVEQVLTKSSHQKSASVYEFSEKQSPQKLTDIKPRKEGRISSNIQELDRILGGGIVPGSLILIGGEPGIGKSTLALQIAMKLKDFKTLYISGEESARQIKLRAERIGGLEESETLILTETNLDNILNVTSKEKPDLLIIDSIQTLYSEQIESSPGSVSQVRES